MKQTLNQFSSMDFIEIPDDDGEALAAGVPTLILLRATQDSVAVSGRHVYVRASLWKRLKPELEKLPLRQ